jgi:phosphatidylglycerol:prolipoprotein diacylglycerol transferase
MVSMLVYANRKGFAFFQVTDWIAPQVPIALFLGRIANFINAELFGRPTDVPWGMVFPTDPLGLVRHPSQIYEALLEGVMLFIFLNFLIKKTEKVGRHSGYFLIGYGVARSISEIFRTPDAVWGNDFLLFSFLTQGQLLSVPMIVLGVFILSRK